MQLDKKALGKIMDAAAMAMLPAEIRSKVAEAYLMGASAMVDFLGGSEQAHRGGSDTPLQALLRSEIRGLQFDAERLATNGPAAAAPVKSITVGSRNARLFEMGTILRDQGKTYEELRAALLDANRELCEDPLPEHEVTRIVVQLVALKGTEPIGVAK